MVEFDVDPTPLYVFKIDDEYLFSEYFDNTDLFEQLAEYYDDDTYRFEVPAEEFDDSQAVCPQLGARSAPLFPDEIATRRG